MAIDYTCSVEEENKEWEKRLREVGTIYQASNNIKIAIKQINIHVYILYINKYIVFALQPSTFMICCRNALLVLCNIFCTLQNKTTSLHSN